MNKTLTTPLEIKSLSKGQFEGHGSVYGNVDYGGDIVMPGAFKQSLAEYNSEESLPPMFWMHRPDQVPGKWREMSEDQKGLYVKGELASTQLGSETNTLLKMKAVTGMSIGYITKDAEFDSDGNRRIHEAELIEVSIVSLPMNPKATIAHAKTRLSDAGEYVPKPEEIAMLKRDAEHFLQSKGMNRKLAVACAANLLKDLGEEEILEPTSDEEEILESTTEVTPELLEINAGLSDFKEKELLYEMDRRLRRLKNG